MHPELVKLQKKLRLSTLCKIDDPYLDDHNVKLWVKRDDLLHPIISGNKWRKLKYNLDEALSIGADTVISMGGAYSNHLHALAYTGKVLGLRTIGIIRGEAPTRLTPTLQDMENWGMELRFVTRSDYRQYRQYKHWHDLPGITTNQYWLPEGGSNYLAMKGVSELVNEIDIPYDSLCVACGTGTTFAGLIKAAPQPISVIGFATFKNANFIETDIQSLLNDEFHNWELFQNYHFGGFAKHNPDLALFMRDFEDKTIIQLEPVYTGKMLYGLYDLVAKGYFKSGQRIIAVHTGGLQGNRGYI